ncbi:acyl-CoA synthetase [Sciscionella marina]|uniref:acyl-CoA synthetase n=1 Tax=Sciscionella marina TaxID=508770 RepID=UPI00037D7D14|nr:acyl-CoA synthetase [Sciscionella marina]
MTLSDLGAAGSRLALRFPELTLDYAGLAAASGAVAEAVAGKRRVAVYASARPHTAIAVLGATAAGVPVVPLNPKLGERELEHILTDSAPDLLLCAPDEGAHIALDRHEVDPAARASFTEPATDSEDPLFIVYTSGTTGAPKGVVQPRRSLEATISGLADAWAWTAEDVVVHGLPLFHVHGLVLGTLGPILLGGSVHHLGRFEAEAAADALTAYPSTMLFGVPTMYSRVAEAVEADTGLAGRFGAARLLVSGSAPLPASVHKRITAATGQQIIERYGLTETFMNTSVRIDAERRPGTVGVPLAGVDLRITDDAGTEIGEPGLVGEVEVRGPNVFREYLNRADATAEAFRDGWFRTGDMATRDPDGYLRLVGRRSTDLIKSGGYRIGAGEIENALLEHPGVTEAAVTSEPDEDLGERIIAWIVSSASPASETELIEHVASILTPHKRPRVVRFRESLPRNDMGKILKRSLG